MSVRWPPFLRRIVLLQRARRALLADDPAAALHLLASQELECSPPAQDLRRTSIEQLARRAAAAIAADGSRAAGADLALLARFAPEHELAQRRAEVAASSRANGSRARLDRLLEELRRRSSAVAPSPARENNPAVSDPTESDGPRASLFHLAVDDGGEFLVAVGPRLVLGHLRSTGADLRFLADVEAEQAELALEATFHGGEHWRLRPRPPAPPPRVAGRAVDTAGAVLADGDRVELAHNLSMRFRAHPTASASALLALEHGAECHGAQHVLLLAPGAGGRVRIGPRRQRLIRVADLEHEVELELAPDGLVVRCDGGLRRGPLEVPPGPGARLLVECPPRAPVELVVGARPKDRPPFMILLRPIAEDLGGRPR